MGYPRDKRFRPTFHRYGHNEFVEVGSTGAAMPNYGVSRTTAGVYSLAAPQPGVVKYVVLESSASRVQTNSSGVYIGGTTNNEIAATTSLNVNETVTLIGASTGEWLLGTLPSTGWSLAATTQA